MLVFALLRVPQSRSTAILQPGREAVHWPEKGNHLLIKKENSNYEHHEHCHLCTTVTYYFIL